VLKGSFIDVPCHLVTKNKKGSEAHAQVLTGSAGGGGPVPPEEALAAVQEEEGALSAVLAVARRSSAEAASAAGRHRSLAFHRLRGWGGRLGRSAGEDISRRNFRYFREAAKEGGSVGGKERAASPPPISSGTI
jgi:hypothetical protein